MSPEVAIYVRALFGQINADLMANRVPVLLQKSIAPDDLVKLRNPNPGPGAYRGGTARKRSWHESKGSRNKPSVSNKKKNIN